MRNRRIKLVFPFSVILAFALISGSVSSVFAAPPNKVEKVDVLVTFKEKPGPAEQALIRNAGGKVKRSYHIVPTIAASVSKGKLESLRRNPKVVLVEEDITVQVTEEVLPWEGNQIAAEIVHSQNKGQGVKVAILDSGIDLDHPDLRVAGDVSFVDGTVNGDDDYGHGTMVAGIIAALDNGTGAVGVAPGVELYAVKVLNQNGSSVLGSILSGIEWAVDNNMQVMNMSFGGFLNLPRTVRAAIEKAYQSGIVLVAGAGNAGDRDIIFSPARYEPVIAVGATDQQGVRASFSSTGPTLELMAPGVGILSTSRGGGYTRGNGTSYSAPYVTGMAALLIASGVTNNFELRQILQITAEDLGAPGRDSWYGFGLVNAAEAMKAVINYDPSDKIPPTTRIRTSGLQGNNGWYRSDVLVELTAADNIGGSGVANTQYSLDSGETWQNYNEPFTINNEGIYTIQARSRDKFGNMEGIPASSGVKIDKTEPSVNISVDPSLIWSPNPKEEMVEISVTASASDEISGLEPFQLRVEDEYGQVEPIIGPYPQGQVQLEASREENDLDGRVYTISITAIDYAGNTATAEATVTVLHDNGKKKLNKEKTNKKKLNKEKTNKKKLNKEKTNKKKLNKEKTNKKKLNKEKTNKKKRIRRK